MQILGKKVLHKSVHVGKKGELEKKSREFFRIFIFSQKCETGSCESVEKFSHFPRLMVDEEWTEWKGCIF